MKKVIMGAVLIVAGISLIPQGWAAEEKGCAGGGCDNVGTSQPGGIGSEANEAGTSPPPQKQFKLWDETQVWRHVEWAKSPRKSLIGFFPCDPIPKALGVPPADPRRLKFLEDLRDLYCQQRVTSDENKGFLLKLLDIRKIDSVEYYGVNVTYNVNDVGRQEFMVNYARFHQDFGFNFVVSIRMPYSWCITTENLRSIFGIDEYNGGSKMSFDTDQFDPGVKYYYYNYAGSKKRIMDFYFARAHEHSHEYAVFDSMKYLDYCLRKIGYY